MAHSPGKLDQARGHIAAGRYDQARRVLTRMIQSGERGQAVDAAMGATLVRVEEAEQARFYLRRALDAAPDDLATRVSLAVALALLGLDDESHGLLAEPGGCTVPAAAWSAAAEQLDARGRPDASESMCRAGLLAFPADVGLSLMLRNALLITGDAEGAYRALADLPAHTDDLTLATALCQASSASHTARPPEIAGVHRSFGRILERLRPGAGSAFPAVLSADRPLRVGIVTYEVRFGAVSFFLEPALEGLAGPEFAVVAYHTGPEVDQTTHRLRGRLAALHHVPGIGADNLACRIREDRIDIALELNGHTGDCNLPAFQPRCAPVQASYLGYPNTTGMRAFDHRIVDSITDPTGAADALATEHLVRLDPCFLCYRPFALSPPVTPPPCLGTGRAVTFGSFNDTVKLNPLVFALWARVLAATASSRIIIKARLIGRPGVDERIRAAFVAAGIDPARILLRGYSHSFADHLAAYAGVDVALDTFPYNGTTTTCEALHMGVPVVGLVPRPEHDRHAARVGLSLLGAAGMPELIARDEDEYVGLATALAGDRSRLREVRATLRGRLSDSALCNAPAFGLRFAAALRSMWRSHVAGQQA